MNYKISRSQKVHFGLAEVGLFLISQFFGGALARLYTDYIGIPAVYYGYAHVVFSIWNAINDPLFGFLSDRKKPDPVKGKRLPFIKWGFPIAFVGFLIMLMAPPSSDLWVKVTFLLGGLCVYDFGLAMFFSSKGALAISITIDPEERASLSLYIKLIILIPGGLGGLLPTFFFTEDYPYGTILVMILSMAVILGGISLYSIFKIKEPYALYLNRDGELDEEYYEQMKNQKAIKEILRNMAELLRYDAFLMYTLFAFLIAMVVGTYQSLLVYLLDDVYELGGVESVIVMGAGGLIINIYYPIVKKIFDKLGGVKTITYSMCFTIAGYIFIFLTNSFWTLVLGYCVVAVGFSSYWMCASLLLADVADEYFVKTGIERQATIFTTQSLLITPAPSIMILIFTQIIDYYGYIGKTDREELGLTSLPTRAKTGIELAIVIVPIFIIIAALILLQFYPLKGKRLEEMREKLHEMKSYAFQETP